ncbi:MAG: phosphatidylglycerophosphatase A [Kofleriaceae bacterium]|nr:phosphatidylglycerophosphatase A [Kofleriaceae bacterium]
MDLNTTKATDRLGRLLSNWASAAYRHPVITLFIVSIITVGLGLGARRLKINPDLTELLPADYGSVVNLDKLRTDVGGIGHLTVVCTGEDEDAMKRYSDRLATALAALAKVRYVDHKRPVEFFEDRALFYMDLEDLQEVHKRFAARELYERLQANPLFIDLDEDEGPPELEFDDIREKYKKRAGSGEDEIEAYFMGKDKKRLVLFVKPTKLASDLDFSKALVSDVEAVIATIVLDEFDAKMTVELSGRYKKRIDMQGVVQDDLRTATLIALILMLAYLGLHFRRISSVILVVTPLLVGLIWTYGLAGWTLGSLNILTAFIGAILLGVGIDIGIHVLDRAEQERSLGSEEAVRKAFAQSGKAAAIATFTTVAGFASLSISDFRVFREFGILSSSGLFLVLLSYLMCLPVLLRVRDRIVSNRTSSSAPRFPYASAILNWSPWPFWMCTWGIFAALVWSSANQFDYDFASLESQDLRSYQLDREVNELLGHSQTPLILMSQNAQEARLAAEALRKRKETGERSGIDRVTTGSDIVPKGQEAKAEILAKLAETVALIDPESLEDDEKQDLADLRRMSAAKPFAYADLPDSVRRSFHAAGGSGDFVLIFPGISLTDGAKIQGLASELSNVPVTSGEGAKTLSATGEAMILADVLDSVFREAPRSIGIAVIVILLTLWLMVGQLRTALLCLFPAVVTVAVTIGLMPLVGIKFNYLNIIILPILLGMGVDGGTHLLSHVADQSSLLKGLTQAGHSIVGALVTTALGFVALLAVSHPGLGSIARLALLGLSVNLLATIVLLPATIALWGKREKFVRFAEDLSLVPMIVTVARAGSAPKGPGSLGAFAALPLAWLMQDFSPWMWTAVLVPMTVVSIWICDLYVKKNESKDPQEIVLDETVGCLIALAFVPWQPVWVILAYIAFRFFDMVKPGPIGMLDRRATGGFGVMMDDVVAGIFAGILLYALGIWL